MTEHVFQSALKKQAGIIALLCVAFFLSPLVTAADNESFSLTITPKIMKVGDVVKATIESSAFETKTAFIAWLVDGKSLTQGVGLKTISFTLKDTATHTLSAQATDTKGVVYVGQTGIRASQIDILWEAETLIPPWFRGRALPSLQSTIRAETFTQMPHPESYIYSWSVDGDDLSDASGLGKNSITYKMPMFVDTILLAVRVSTTEGDYVGDTSVRIRTQKPIVRLYEQKPLLGPWFSGDLEHAPLSDNAPTIFAFPYYFSGKSLSDESLTFTIKSTGQYKAADSPYGIVLSGATEGDSIEAQVTHKQKLLQDGKVRSRLNQTVTGTESPFGN